MDYIIEKNDIKRWDKISKLNNRATFWEDIRALTKNIKSDHSLGRWQCLAECRYEELKGE